MTGKNSKKTRFQAVIPVLNAGQLSIHLNGKNVFLNQRAERKFMVMERTCADSRQRDEQLKRTLHHPNAETSGDNCSFPCHGFEPATVEKMEDSSISFFRFTQDGKKCQIPNTISAFQDILLVNDNNGSATPATDTALTPLTSATGNVHSTVIRKGATLGANCTIYQGVTIGEYAYIGVGAVVMDDVPDHALVVGNPARIKGWVCRCGNRLRFSREDRSCCSSCCFRYIALENRILFVSGSKGDDSLPVDFIPTVAQKRAPGHVFPD